MRLAEVSGVDPSALVLDSPREGLRARRGFYWHDLLHRHDPPRPWRRWADRLLPAGVSRRRVSDAAAGYLADLLFVNALRVEGDLNDRVQESRRVLESELTTILRELTESAEEGLERARRTRQAGADAVRAAVAGLDQRLRVVEGIMAAHRPIATAR